MVTMIIIIEKILVLLRNSDWHKLEEINKEIPVLTPSDGGDYPFLAGILHK